MHTLTSLLILATEGGIPASSPWAKLAVPIGIVVFIGPIFLLLRSNLGTRLGYLVMSVTLWGSTFLFALFWTFGAPGTPAFTGPQNLPGQELDEYLPIWVPLAQDALAVTEEGSPYSVIAGYPDGFTAEQNVSDDVLEGGQSDIQSFFSSLSDPYTALLDGTEAIQDTQFATADNGRPVIAVTFTQTCQLDPDGILPGGCEEAGQPLPDGETTTLFAFFDAGTQAFPSYLMLGGTFVLFALHMVLLARDERRMKAEEAELAEDQAEAEAQQKAPVSA